MKITNEISEASITTLKEKPIDLLQPLLAHSVKRNSGQIAGTVIGELLGILDSGQMPLVAYPGQPGSAAIAARTIISLYAAQIGQQVVLTFEDSDPSRPIIIGTLRAGHESTLDSRPNSVEVESDGDRLTVSAKEQLVLRCGDASITLTKNGAVIVRGTSVSTQATGVNRIKGGSVQIN